jgi:hypothetical protein
MIEPLIHLTPLASIPRLVRCRRAKGHRAEEDQMNEAAEAFMDQWLDANVTHKHAKKPSARMIKSLAKRCVADAAAKGISLDVLEEVVVDIEEAIEDELNFIETMKAKAP